MRILILSDIHANHQALEAVLEDAAGHYDSIVCLGDVVGYGADPNRVARWVRANVPQTIRGNHDRACVGDPVVEDFNENAQAASAWTLETLEPENRDWLLQLPKGPLEAKMPPGEEFFLCHGSPRDEDEYITDKATASHQFSYLPGNVVFFGHTHWQGGYRIAPGRATLLEPPRGTEPERRHCLDRDRAYLVNPGSVGQPRDCDPRAGYALYDTLARTVALRRVDYDILSAQQAILTAGLPAFLAFRLGEGL